MWPIKLRIITGACILLVVGTLLVLLRGPSGAPLVVVVGGVIILGVGLLWPKPKNAEPEPRNPE